MESNEIRESDNTVLSIWRLPDGKLHREDGPAYTSIYGEKEWWVNGKKHRLDGPAIEYIFGYTEWWINGYEITQYIIPWAKEMNIDIDNISEYEANVISMVWGDYDGKKRG